MQRKTDRSFSYRNDRDKFGGAWIVTHEQSPYNNRKAVGQPQNRWSTLNVLGHDQDSSETYSNASERV
jgi:hypothetical protein